MYVATRQSSRHQIVAAVFGAAALLPLLALRAESQERHTLRGSHVTVWNLAGRAVIEAGSGSEVVVEVTRGGSEGDRITSEASNDRLVLRYPERDIVYRDTDEDWRWETRLSVERDGTFSNSWDGPGRSVRIRSSGSGLEAHADLRISVPKGQHFTLQLGAGRIEARNLDGRIELRTRVTSLEATDISGQLTASNGSGRVRILRAKGDIVASSGSGRVELEDIESGSVRASTGSGGIRGSGLRATRVDVNTGSGSIVLEDVATDELRGNTGSGSVRVELTRNVRDVVIRTGSGGVTLALPDDASAEVDLSTGSGGITTDFPVTMDEVRRNRLRGELGDGRGGRIRVSTGSGGVRLRKHN